jgi:hypothetical protein
MRGPAGTHQPLPPTLGAPTRSQPWEQPVHRPLLNTKRGSIANRAEIGFRQDPEKHNRRKDDPCDEEGRENDGEDDGFEHLLCK